MFCFLGQDLTASIEVDDGANFLVLELTTLEADQMERALGDLTENVRVCVAWSKAIDGMVERGRKWRALGAR